jgi:hypothetical protein
VVCVTSEKVAFIVGEWVVNGGEWVVNGLGCVVRPTTSAPAITQRVTQRRDDRRAQIGPIIAKHELGQIQGGSIRVRFGSPISPCIHQKAGTRGNVRVAAQGELKPMPYPPARPTRTSK